MAERINEELVDCSNSPKCRPYVCITAGRLTSVMDRIKSLDNENFLKVYEIAKKVDLPQDFSEELESQYKERF